MGIEEVIVDLSIGTFMGTGLLAGAVTDSETASILGEHAMTSEINQVVPKMNPQCFKCLITWSTSVKCITVCR